MAAPKTLKQPANIIFPVELLGDDASSEIPFGLECVHENVEGVMDGIWEGKPDGFMVMVGLEDGRVVVVGMAERDGEDDFTTVGLSVGLKLGSHVGVKLAFTLGDMEGANDVTAVGDPEGTMVGGRSRLALGDVMSTSADHNDPAFQI
eukprot:CAMPEP_0195297256 /NCGR_PEP_ID=MMETSP0707-20130614/21173_1 /TAXON_ID=33640 /ORGANISM="Asterionellopsis glacialis, Strain CCMP134" /LENGTH=147 /DNA_ID=CAMNT_0040359027 /DNA_START=448 /DNA_END=891 /DNA_ORIENTATION=+